MQELEKRFKTKTANVGIIGLGYVGLPLAREFLRSGFRVIGFDNDAEKIRRLQAGKSYIGHIPSHQIDDMVRTGRFAPTADFDRLAEPDAIAICVPTPLTPGNEPDLGYVVSATEEIAKRLRKGQLVILESTTYPGTTREVLLPILARSGLNCGEDYFLAFSPEREDPGNARYTTGRIPKIVGGLDEMAGRLCRILYRQVVVDVVEVKDADTAEAVKILENTYRAVNIALVNELKSIFTDMGIDIWDVVSAAATKPFGFSPFYPGPGIGGHCIPIDPFYLSWKAKQFDNPTRFIKLAGDVNFRQPEYVVERLEAALKDEGKEIKGAKLLILGVAYKRDVDDLRESPALRIMHLLRDRGADISYHDPHIPRITGVHDFVEWDMTRVPFSSEALATHDAVLVITDHSGVDYRAVAEHSKLVVDTRNALGGIRVDKGARIVKA
ncbi:MAG: nucleotide sugar dehydrogenase [Planctomycetota bacterium]|nr:MAG: nucleotide sugar dehydrogenase [Planctomycetota bacterium]